MAGHSKWANIQHWMRMRGMARRSIASRLAPFVHVDA
jgi:transcriptional/translational regulatory protein YebC/TACO1